MHTGTDPIGSYSEVSVSWSAASTRTTADAAAAAAALMVTGLRTYASAPGVAVLTQRFPSGLSPSSPPHRHAGNDTAGAVEGVVGRTNYDDIVSAFPSLRASHQDLAVTWYEGVQLQNSYVFPWTAGTPFASEDPGPGGKKAATTDGGGMPLILTNAAADTLVMSPLEDFFTSTQGRSEQLLGNVSLGLQVMVCVCVTWGERG